MAKIIKIRGHHIPSIFEYCRIRRAHLGKDPFSKLRANGYEREYIENKREICELIYQHPNQEIRVVSTLDDLCKVCNKREKRCSNLRFTDPFVAGQYGITSGDTYTSAQLLSYSKRSPILF